jgi:hypothetical protein
MASPRSDSTQGRYPGSQRSHGATFVTLSLQIPEEWLDKLAWSEQLRRLAAALMA